MISDDHSESDQRGVAERLQTAWARVLEDVILRRARPSGAGERESSRGDAQGRVTPSLPERLPRRSVGEFPQKLFRSVAMPSMTGLGWRDRIEFGFTGASILLALLTIAIVVSDMLARGTPRSG